MTLQRHNVLIGLAGACLACSITSALATDLSATSKAVWDGHLQKVMAKNLDAVMADFTDASVIVTTDKVSKYLATPLARGPVTVKPSMSRAGDVIWPVGL